MPSIAGSDYKLTHDPRVNRALKGTALEYEWGQYIDYFLYNPKGYLKGGALGPIGDMSNSQGIKLAADSIAFCASGVQDLNKRMHLMILSGKQASALLTLLQQEHGTGKYGRLLGWLYIGDGDVSLNEQMITEGYAHPYDGGTKDMNLEALREIRRAHGTLI